MQIIVSLTRVVGAAWRCARLRPGGPNGGLLRGDSDPPGECRNRTIPKACQPEAGHGGSRVRTRKVLERTVPPRRVILRPATRKLRPHQCRQAEGSIAGFRDASEALSRCPAIDPSGAST